MTLNAMRLANFKAFGASQRVPLRPITLLFGANSAGKSSVLHALALTHHAIETGDLDTPRTRIGGDSIDLGGFLQYVHRRQADGRVVFAFELDLAGLTGRLGEPFRSARAAEVEFVVGGCLPSAQQTLFGETPRELDTGGSVGVERFSLEIDGQPLLSMSVRRCGLLRLDRLNHTHRVFRDAFQGPLAVATAPHDVQPEDFATLGEVLDELVREIWARRRGLFPTIGGELSDQGVTVSGTDLIELLAIDPSRRNERLSQSAKLFLPQVVHDLVAKVNEVLATEIARFLYLGPLRSYPRRHVAFSQEYGANWIAGGGYAWDVVRARGDVRARVNEWLGDPERLKTPYELQVRELIPAGDLEAEVAPRLGGRLYELALTLLEELERGEPLSDSLASALELIRRNAALESDVDDETLEAVGEVVDAIADSEVVAEEWVREIVETLETRGDTRSELVLIDKRSGTPVSHRDVGIGVSQVLPVLVSAYASTAKLIAIEQPEIHLHPALQAELGDVFLESALGGAENRFLIETHSEHLLLRIMRRMRETAAGKLRGGLLPVRPEDVAVLFIEPDGAHSLVREMPLNERGDLVKAWPGGFFEESMREIL